jgi:hypothetical protein
MPPQRVSSGWNIYWLGDPKTDADGFTYVIRVPPEKRGSEKDALDIIEHIQYSKARSQASTQGPSAASLQGFFMSRTS